MYYMTICANLSRLSTLPCMLMMSVLWTRTGIDQLICRFLSSTALGGWRTHEYVFAMLCAQPTTNNGTIPIWRPQIFLIFFTPLPPCPHSTNDFDYLIHANSLTTSAFGTPFPFQCGCHMWMAPNPHSIIVIGSNFEVVIQRRRRAEREGVKSKSG